MGQLVEIAHCWDPEEAVCIRSLLSGYGLRVHIPGDQLLAVQPWLRVALGGFQILAPQEYAAEAQALLTEARTEAESRLFGSEEVDSRGRRKAWLWLPIAFFMGMPFVPLQRNDLIGAIQGVALVLLYFVVALSLPYSLGAWVY